jgi:hypothetical protein
LRAGDSAERSKNFLQLRAAHTVTQISHIQSLSQCNSPISGPNGSTALRAGPNTRKPAANLTESGKARIEVYRKTLDKYTSETEFRESPGFLTSPLDAASPLAQTLWSVEPPRGPESPLRRRRLQSCGRR